MNNIDSIICTCDFWRKLKAALRKAGGDPDGTEEYANMKLKDVVDTLAVNGIRMTYSKRWHVNAIGSSKPRVRQFKKTTCSKKLINRLMSRKPEASGPPPKVWKQWEHNGWGDSIMWVSTRPPRKLTGLTTPIPSEGDLLHAKMQSGRVGVFKMVNIKWLRDPDDMWEADAVKVGCVDEENSL